MSETKGNAMNDTTIAKLERQIERCKAEIRRTETILNKQSAVPGWTVTGRSNRSQSLTKKLDRENDRHIDAAVQWQAARDELRHLEARLEAYRAGEVYGNGQVRKDAPSRVKRKKAQDMYADFMKSILAAGSMAALVDNPSSRIKVVRVNKVTVTDEHGEKWNFHDLLPLNNGGTPMDETELRAAVRLWQSQDTST